MYTDILGTFTLKRKHKETKLNSFGPAPIIRVRGIVKQRRLTVKQRSVRSASANTQTCHRLHCSHAQMPNFRPLVQLYTSAWMFKRCVCAYAIITKISCAACADPESFARSTPTLTTFSFL